MLTSNVGHAQDSDRAALDDTPIVRKKRCSVCWYASWRRLDGLTIWHVVRIVIRSRTWLRGVHEVPISHVWSLVEVGEERHGQSKEKVLIQKPCRGVGSKVIPGDSSVGVVTSRPQCAVDKWKVRWRESQLNTLRGQVGFGMTNVVINNSGTGKGD